MVFRDLELEAKMIFYSLLIIFFTYFYTAIAFNPVEPEVSRYATFTIYSNTLKPVIQLVKILIELSMSE